MKKKLLRYTSLAFIVILLIIICEFSLRPVAKIGSKTVRMHELLSYAIKNTEYETERMAEDIALERLAEEAGVKVYEIENEVLQLEMNRNKGKKLCRKVILHQRLIEKYAAEITVTAEEARKYYEEHKDQYGGTEPEFERIKHDIQMESGTEKYEELFEKIMTENEVQILN